MARDLQQEIQGDDLFAFLDSFQETNVNLQGTLTDALGEIQEHLTVNA